MEEELLPLQQRPNYPICGKTSIMNKVGGECNSPLMTTADPKRKKPELLKDDSCLKFKMKECIMTGKTDKEEESSFADSPNLKKSMGGPAGQSRFGQ
jgi:hypothetical protein